VAWRKAGTGPAAGAVAELLAYADECETAGDTAGLAAARSWLDMYAATGYDPEVAELLAGFAADDRAIRAQRGLA